MKLGKFVKAAVLISPPPIQYPEAFEDGEVMKLPEICQHLPVMIVLGNKSKDYFAEAERLRGFS